MHIDHKETLLSFKHKDSINASQSAKHLIAYKARKNDSLRIQEFQKQTMKQKCMFFVRVCGGGEWTSLLTRCYVDNYCYSLPASKFSLKGAILIFRNQMNSAVKLKQNKKKTCFSFDSPQEFEISWIKNTYCT